MDKCDWCGCTNVKVVKQGWDDHHICQKYGCAHEWDVVSKHKGESK